MNAKDSLPADFEAKAKASFAKIPKPEVTFGQYLEFQKAEFARLTELERNPRLRYQPAARPAKPPNTPCGNADFESSLDQTEWHGAYGSWPASGGQPDVTTFTAGILSGAITSAAARQTWVPAGTDPTLQALGVSLPTTGPNFSGSPSAGAVRIGNAVYGSGSELLAKTFTVTAAQSLIKFWYAVVFQDPSHPAALQPFFMVRVTDASGTELTGLVNLGNGTGKLIADSSNPFFYTQPAKPNPPIVYKDWTCAQIDLSKYVGQVVTVEFVTADCGWGAHFGYAYIDNFCGDCTNSPEGNIDFEAAASSSCGPGQLVFSYSLPTVHNAGVTTTGTVKITLSIYQNGVLLETLASPVLSTGTSYSFPITPSAIPGINTSLGGFDYVAKATFALAGFTPPPMSVGALPDGRVAGQNNDYAISCPPGKWCCPGASLLKNGDFEAGNTGFTSQYTFNPATTPGATIPGEYNIVTSAQALAISPLWVASDHYVCIGGTGTSKFMVVNGKTCQSGSKAIWRETVNVKPGEYRFCANVKNFKQCTFDIPPKLTVEFIAPGPVNLPSTVPVTVVNTTNSPCDWHLIFGSVVVPSACALIIEILLDETGLGDGNDLALDDISFQFKPPANHDYALVNTSQTNIGGGKYTISATPANLPPGYGYYWDVCEIDNAGNPVPGTDQANPSQWWVIPNTFQGYQGTSGPLGTTPNPGEFETAKRYRITFGVWSDCAGWTQSSWILQENTALKKIEVIETTAALVDPKLRVRPT